MPSTPVPKPIPSRPSQPPPAFSSPPRSSLVSKLINRCFPISISENSSEASRKKLFIFLTLCSALLFVIASLIAVFSILAFTRIGNPFDDAYIVAVLLLILVYSTLALTSLVGVYCLFASSSNPRIAILTVLSAAFGSLLIISLGVTAFGLFFLFEPIPSEDDAWICQPSNLAEVHDPFLAFICERSALLKGLSIAFLIFSWFLQFALMFGYRQYSRKIKAHLDLEKLHEIK
ncbi:hypothetical protein JOM56_009349 [Amanita muscaria]